MATISRFKFCVYFALAICLTSCNEDHYPEDNQLKVVIIRHAEKPKDGDNLSCQGQNRALQLSSVLYQTIKLADYIYVPTVSDKKATKHGRMYQTVAPYAIKYNLKIDSQYDEKSYEDLAKNVLKKNGTVLIAWSHQIIPQIGSALGLRNLPEWPDEDFDSVWVITYHHHEARLSIGKQSLHPAKQCAY